MGAALYVHRSRMSSLLSQFPHASISRGRSAFDIIHEQRQRRVNGEAKVPTRPRAIAADLPRPARLTRDIDLVPLRTGRGQGGVGGVRHHGGRSERSTLVMQATISRRGG